MSKAVMISIRPEWCEKIGSGEKTIEVRKSRPKLPTPFKCYIYCTKGKYPHEDFLCFDAGTNKVKAFYGGGMVIGEFVCDRIEVHNLPYPAYQSKVPAALLTSACLLYSDLHSYVGSDGRYYTWHISDLVIYDEPKPLTDFYRPPCERMSDCGCCPMWDRENRACKRPPIMLRAPQSWCYVEERTMTNADKIRAMTDEELADFINDAEWGFIDRPGMCDVCDHNLNSPKKCLQCWLDWLKQEVQND